MFFSGQTVVESDIENPCHVKFEIRRPIFSNWSACGQELLTDHLDSQNSLL